MNNKYAPRINAFSFEKPSWLAVISTLIDDLREYGKQDSDTIDLLVSMGFGEQELQYLGFDQVEIDIGLALASDEYKDYIKASEPTSADEFDNYLDRCIVNEKV